MAVKIIISIIAILLVLFFFLMVFSMCIVAGRADDSMDFEDDWEEISKKEKTKY